MPLLQPHTHPRLCTRAPKPFAHLIFAPDQIAPLRAPQPLRTRSRRTSSCSTAHQATLASDRTRRPPLPDGASAYSSHASLSHQWPSYFRTSPRATNASPPIRFFHHHSAVSFRQPKTKLYLHRTNSPSSRQAKPPTDCWLKKKKKRI